MRSKMIVLPPCLIWLHWRILERSTTTKIPSSNWSIVILSAVPKIPFGLVCLFSYYFLWVDRTLFSRCIRLDLLKKTRQTLLYISLSFKYTYINLIHSAIRSSFTFDFLWHFGFMPKRAVRCRYILRLAKFSISNLKLADQLESL